MDWVCCSHDRLAAIKLGVATDLYGSTAGYRGIYDNINQLDDMRSHLIADLATAKDQINSIRIAAMKALGTVPDAAAWWLEHLAHAP
jgi:hypothetical protein